MQTGSMKKSYFLYRYSTFQDQTCTRRVNPQYQPTTKNRKYHWQLTVWLQFCLILIGFLLTNNQKISNTPGILLCLQQLSHRTESFYVDIFKALIFSITWNYYVSYIPIPSYNKLITNEIYQLIASYYKFAYW